MDFIRAGLLHSSKDSVILDEAMTNKILSIIIPAFNEEECLPALLTTLDKIIENELHHVVVEVMIVDDHSTDSTSDILEGKAADYSWLNYIRLLKNSGSHVAIFAGLSVCKGDMAFIMAADLQDPPEIIPLFIQQIAVGYKIVLGEREGRKDPYLRQILSSVFNYFMSRFVARDFPVRGGDVFLIDRDIIDAVLQCEEKNANIFVLMLSLCKDVGVVKYRRQERYAGVSKWNVSQLFKLAYDSIIMVGYLPLRLVMWVGILSFLLSVLMVCYLLIAKLTGLIHVEGWTSILAAIVAFGGIHMISISIVGEYLWRNFDQTRKRPIFIIQRSRLLNQESVQNDETG